MCNPVKMVEKWEAGGAGARILTFSPRQSKLYSEDFPPGGKEKRKGASPMNNKNFPHLCSPIRIRNVTFRSRMCSAPMGSVDIPADGCLGRAAAKFYELRARGGAAAVTASEVIVDPATDGTQGFFLDNAIPAPCRGRPRWPTPSPATGRWRPSS